MMIKVEKNKHKSHEQKDYSVFNDSTAEEVFQFHNAIPGYKPTPLRKLKSISRELGLKNIWIKDESLRFDLKAFKVLGASYAFHKILSLKFPALLKNKTIFDEDIKSNFEKMTFVTATDGNHGRGVAWTANKIGCNCKVFMPKGTTDSRYNNIKLLGADVEIINASYDEAVNKARDIARENDFVLVQDSSWNGYEEIPLWITQGYLTLMKEILDQLKGEYPTHVFIQSGVGSLPAAVAAFLFNKFGIDRPVFVVVEPVDAGCFYHSNLGKGKAVTLTNEMKTIMAGLACGTPSKLAWEILKELTDFYAICSDDVAIKGMQILGKYKSSDEKIISGESGAVTAGFLYNLISQENKHQARMLGLDENSKILLISTEGDTDPELYLNLMNKEIA